MHSFPFNPLDRFYGTTSSSSGTSSTKGHQRLRGRAFDFCSFLMRKQRERETTLFIQQSHLGRNGPVERFPNGKRTRRNSAIFLGFRSVRRDWSKWSTPPPILPKKKKRPISWEVQLNGGGNRISEHQHQSGFPSLIIDYQRCPSIDTQDPTTFLWSSRLKRLHFFFQPIRRVANYR